MNTCEKRKLGSSGVEVSIPGMGLWAVGGHWGPTNDKEALAAIDAALDGGVTFFDTADVYGNGSSEELLGKAMQGRREKFVVATKLGWMNYDGENNRSAYDTVEKLIAGVEENLSRLKTDHLDVIQNHVFYREPNTDVFIEAFLKLKEQGKVRACGLSTSDFEFVKDFHSGGACDVLQIDYSILNRTAEAEIFPFCESRGIGVIIRGSLAMGILTGKFDRNPSFQGDDFRKGWVEDEQQRARFLKDLETVEELRAAFPDRSPLELAIRFVMANSTVSTVIAGARRPAQVVENLMASRGPALSAADFESLNRIVAPGGGRKIWPA